MLSELVGSVKGSASTDQHDLVWIHPLPRGGTDPAQL